MSMFSDYETAINDFGGLGSEHTESLLEDSLASWYANATQRANRVSAVHLGERTC